MYLPPSNHSRGYVHHLLKAKELLGDVLLQCHNHYQLLKLFDFIRIKLKDKSIDNWFKIIIEK